MSELTLQPLSLRDGNALVDSLHRHHERVQGHKFSIGCTWKGMGGKRICTYILATEPGTSLHAAGWVFMRDVPATKGWDRPSRRRKPVPQAAKKMYGLPNRAAFGISEPTPGDAQ